MFPQFDARTPRSPATKGTRPAPVPPSGKIVFDSDAAGGRRREGKTSSSSARETNPDDLPGMVAAAGILTTRGGKTSHAAVVARGMGKTCVCGATESIEIDSIARTLTFPDGKCLVEATGHLDRRLHRRGLRGEVAGHAERRWSSTSTPASMPPSTTPKRGDRRPVKPWTAS
jgi:pyruvate,orthophosphate dikinase